MIDTRLGHTESHGPSIHVKAKLARVTTVLGLLRVPRVASSCCRHASSVWVVQCCMARRTCCQLWPSTNASLHHTWKFTAQMSMASVRVRHPVYGWPAMPVMRASSLMQIQRCVHLTLTNQLARIGLSPDMAQRRARFSHARHSHSLPTRPPSAQVRGRRGVQANPPNFPKRPDSRFPQKIASLFACACGACVCWLSEAVLLRTCKVAQNNTTGHPQGKDRDKIVLSIVDPKLIRVIISQCVVRYTHSQHSERAVHSQATAAAASFRARQGAPGFACLGQPRPSSANKMSL
jgi:hypothetical protein